LDAALEDLYPSTAFGGQSRCLHCRPSYPETITFTATQAVLFHYKKKVLSTKWLTESIEGSAASVQCQ
jgi:hypothetical protein